jgi:hypothetical protein
MMSAEEVRKGLGLTPFEGFARKQLESLPVRVAEALASNVPMTPEEHLRQTGRSTRMICSLLAAVSSGRPVAIYAKPQAHEYQLKDKAQQWAEQLGLNPKLIHGHLASIAEIEFFDHTWYEIL